MYGKEQGMKRLFNLRGVILVVVAFAFSVFLAAEPISAGAQSISAEGTIADIANATILGNVQLIVEVTSFDHGTGSYFVPPFYNEQHRIEFQLECWYVVRFEEYDYNNYYSYYDYNLADTFHDYSLLETCGDPEGVNPSSGFTSSNIVNYTGVINPNIDFDATARRYHSLQDQCPPGPDTFGERVITAHFRFDTDHLLEGAWAGDPWGSLAYVLNNSPWYTMSGGSVTQD